MTFSKADSKICLSDTVHQYFKRHLLFFYLALFYKCYKYSTLENNKIFGRSSKFIIFWSFSSRFAFISKSKVSLLSASLNCKQKKTENVQQAKPTKSKECSVCTFLLFSCLWYILPHYRNRSI